MRGAIVGDIVGSGFEGSHPTALPAGAPLFGPDARFTDDTVMTVAVMDALLAGVAAQDEETARTTYRTAFHRYGNLYPHAGYGGMFRGWLRTDGSAGYDSFGNGAIMRVSPVGWLFSDLAEVERQAVRTTYGTHEHAESRRAAKAVATTILLARTAALPDRDALCARVEREYGYDLSRPFDRLRAERSANVTCMGTVPIVFAILRECRDLEHALRMAILAGGDVDTNACIAASMAEAWFGMPDDLWNEARRRLDARLRGVVDRFLERTKEVPA